MLLLIVALAASPLLLQSCGGSHDGGSNPPARISSLLSPSTLKTWIDNGYVDDRGNKVVILDTSFGGSARSDYDAGHIPGAHYVDFASELLKTRSDGPIEVALMVADGPQFDAHIQKYGIDDSTTVVFTGHHIFWTTRAYWTYRYWGFPQDHLFVLDGKATTANSVWTAAGYALETTEPALPAPSSFSVAAFAGNQDAVRAPLEEFLSVASGGVANAKIVDTRAAAEWNADPPATRAFEFRAKNSIWREWSEELVGADYTEKTTGSHVLRPIEDITAELEAAGLNANTTIYTL
jgi:3-mercaptopyruvate sulfurtransferase SseA